MYINDLVETHCHVLPGIDDGSKDVAESLELISLLKNQGAHKIICTSHYYSNEISLEHFVKRRNHAYEKLKKELPPDSPELILTAEVYMSKFFFTNEDISELCVGSSRYILVEHPFTSTFSDQTYDRLVNMCIDYRVVPILAHIERYDALMNKKGKLEQYLDMGCLAQANISSFVTGPRHIRKKLFKFLEEGKIQLVGSDCHNLTDRRPDYGPGMEEIRKRYGRSAVRELVENANKITE